MTEFKSVFKGLAWQFTAKTLAAQTRIVRVFPSQVTQAKQVFWLGGID
jgi:hypothetical protein